MLDFLPFIFLFYVLSRIEEKRRVVALGLGLGLSIFPSRVACWSYTESLEEGAEMICMIYVVEVEFE